VSTPPTATFSLGAILSVAQRRMLSPSGPPEFCALVFHLVYGPGVPAGHYLFDDQTFARCAAELGRSTRSPHATGLSWTCCSNSDWARVTR
jgi:hypothetical protein